MEVGVDVWLKDTRGSDAWLEAIVESKTQSSTGIEIIVKTDYEGKTFKFKYVLKIKQNYDTYYEMSCISNELITEIIAQSLHVA
jgi:hypothetical protein